MFERRARELLNFPPEGPLPSEMMTLVTSVSEALQVVRMQAFDETLVILESSMPAEWVGMAESHRGAREVLLSCLRRVRALRK